ncbi:MAG: NADP-dependent oxidoreductase [Kurthia sp.]|nr:NADP-dependent oxidoreductase [Candidatus Kurthia equi]
MKVLGYSTYGKPSVFTEKNIETPVINANEVLLRTKYSSIHPVDTIIRNGDFSGGAPLQQFLIPGSEVLGEIVEVGSAITDFALGDVVIGKPGRGGYAEYVKVDQSKIFKKPANMPDEAAAGFSAVGTTAYYSLFDFGQIKTGETITILGASGGVGSIAIQIARNEGLYVIAVASEKNKDYVLHLGADEFADYNDPSQLAGLANRADVVIDASLFASSAEAGVALVKDGGHYITLTSSPAAPLDKSIHIIDMRRNAEMTDKKAMDYLIDLHEKQPIEVKPTTVYPLSLQGVVDAHTTLEAGTLSKKILLKNEMN